MFLIQIFLIIIIFFLFWITDLLTLISCGILYLLMGSLLLFFLDSDILINFLLIIDLGVFFIFISFIMMISKYIDNKYNYTNSIKNIFIFLIILFILYFYIMYLFCIDINLNFSLSWNFFINFINYNSISFLIYTTDMVLYKEIYFNINYLEFILINIQLALSLILIYVLYLLILKINFKYINIFNINKISFKKVNSIYFFKNQNVFNQYNIPASSGVFFKKKYDTKANSTINIR